MCWSKFYSGRKTTTLEFLPLASLGPSIDIGENIIG
jgi:hypothetical protein